MPPLIVGMLPATYGSWAIGLMLAVLGLVSLVCTYLLPKPMEPSYVAICDPR